MPRRATGTHRHARAEQMASARQHDLHNTLAHDKGRPAGERLEACRIEQKHSGAALVVSRWGSARAEDAASSFRRPRAMTSAATCRYLLLLLLLPPPESQVNVTAVC